ncbi:MAG: TonB-dependent receptor [Saprospiraceae bacterium]
MRFFKLVLFIFIPLSAISQSGVIKGSIKDKLTNMPIIGANIVLVETSYGSSSDLDGKYELLGLKPGIYNIQVSYIGYETISQSEIEVQGVRPTIFNFELIENLNKLDEVVIKAASFNKTAESPVSLRTIGVSEIKRNPGGNRDISRVIQSLPGVTSTASFRNDLIIRGGAPNENRFFIDDIEVPVINHFATQGSSGGPAGMINVDFVREVDFYSGAFPVSRGNALSSVFNFKLKDGRDDRIGMTATAGATDIGITLDGPLGDKSTFLVSARRSYLQLLFKVIGLPFLPTYTDFNTKYKYKIDNKNEVTFIGLGAIDDFTLNSEANETEAKQFILGRLPVNTQWNYTNGIAYKHYGESGYTTLVLSRNMLNNEATKYFNNDESVASNLILKYKSQEIENKVRLETFQKKSGWNFNIGTSYEFAKYSNSTFNKIYTNVGPDEINYSNQFSLHKYGFYGSLNRKYFKDKLSISIGARIDGNSYSEQMNNPLKQFSPRFSASYQITNKFAYNINLGRYFQLPPYTVLGYSEKEILVNKENEITYIVANNFVSGFEYNISSSGRITIEGYYKKYNNYPFLLREQISLANLGGDFGVIGNEPVTPTSIGRTYGIELLMQQRLYKGFYGILAYTFGHSEFTNVRGLYAPSSWDSRHIINMTAGKRFGKNWEMGLRYRFQSGLPSTPFDTDSDLKINWDRNFAGILNYNKINTLRNDPVNGLDIRIDKKWFFRGWDLNVFLDIQNVTGNSIGQNVLILDRPLDENNMPVGDPLIKNPGAPLNELRYKLKTINDSTGTVLPTIGLVLSF